MKIAVRIYNVVMVATFALSMGIIGVGFVVGGVNFLIKSIC